LKHFDEVVRESVFRLLIESGLAQKEFEKYWIEWKLLITSKHPMKVSSLP